MILLLIPGAAVFPPQNRHDPHQIVKIEALPGGQLHGRQQGGAGVVVLLLPIQVGKGNFHIFPNGGIRRREEQHRLIRAVPVQQLQLAAAHEDFGIAFQNQQRILNGGDFKAAGRLNLDFLLGRCGGQKGRGQRHAGQHGHVCLGAKRGHRFVGGRVEYRVAYRLFFRRFQQIRHGALLQFLKILAYLMQEIQRFKLYPDFRQIIRRVAAHTGAQDHFFGAFQGVDGTEGQIIPDTRPQGNDGNGFHGNHLPDRVESWEWRVEIYIVNQIGFSFVKHYIISTLNS